MTSGKLKKCFSRTEKSKPSVLNVKFASLDNARDTGQQVIETYTPPHTHTHTFFCSINNLGKEGNIIICFTDEKAEAQKRQEVLREFHGLQNETILYLS